MRHVDDVRGATFSADESLILSWGRDGAVRLWDVATGDPVIRPLRHPDDVRRAAFGSDEGSVLTWSPDGFRIWELSGRPDVTPEALVLEIEARTGTRATATGEVRALSRDEWLRVRGEHDRLAARARQAGGGEDPRQVRREASADVTISSTTPAKSTAGDQPRTSRALLASPGGESASVGR
jgi:hypothetical protein